MSIKTYTTIQLYCLFKDDTQSELYLGTVKPNKYKFALSHLRLRSHSLAIETGRYTGIPRSDRICTFCNMNVVENKFHFPLACPYYKYLPAY